MSWLGRIGRGVLGLVVGGPAAALGAVGSVAGGIAGAVGDVAKARIEAGVRGLEADARDRESARQFAAPGTHGTWLDVLVDNANRLPRPVITFYIFGGVVGWWPLADLSKVDPLWLQAGGAVLVFWFGGRLLTKDLPAAVLAVLRALGKGG